MLPVARVKKFGLMTSVLVKSNGDLVYWPNRMLRSSPLTNLTRSEPRSDSISFLIDLHCHALVRQKVLESLEEHCR